ncbi:hypothetical protein C8T65DRAFT_738534 [Cerioporus squamosus]|nr:hypothetical protein C8T65DRAFT_738534 [Cerioporus squamosus]
MSIGDKHLRDTFALMGSQVRDLDSGLQWGSRLNAEKPEQRPQAALAEIAGRFPMLECLQVGVAGYRMLYAVCGCVLSHDGSFEPHNLPNSRQSASAVSPSFRRLICALARLPKLQVLEASLSPRSTWSEKLTPNAFPALRQLILMTTARTYITFSAIATLENVESAHLEITDSPEQSDIPALFQSVRQQFSPSSLRVLEICSRDDFYPEGAMQMGLVARPDHLESLFIFSKLIDLRLTLPCRYALDDACYLKIAHPFPLLRTLSLADCEDCIHDTLPSMSALAPFVQHSNLHTLSVAFNGSQQISLDNIKGALPPRDYPSSVRKPGVGYSPVARPQLENERQERWRMVGQLLACFNLIREDELDMMMRTLARRDSRGGEHGQTRASGDAAVVNG